MAAVKNEKLQYLRTFRLILMKFVLLMYVGPPDTRAKTFKL